MSSYLNIYIKPRGLDAKIYLFSFGRGSDLYQFFSDNNLSGYAYKGDQLAYTKLDMDNLSRCTLDLEKEIARDKDKLATMKSLSGKSTIEGILEWQDYVKEREKLVNDLEWLILLGSDKINDVEHIYTNID